MVRRISHLRLGLTAKDEAAAAAPTPSRGLGLGGPQGEDVGASFVSPRVTTGEPRVKRTRPWTPSSLVYLLRQAAAEPSEDTEPTLEQVSAVHQVIMADMVALCRCLNCSVRMVRDCCTISLSSIGPPGLTAPGNGRSCFGHPASSYRTALFRVHRTAILLLDVAPPRDPGQLRRDGQEPVILVRRADVQIRSDQFERLIRSAERERRITTPPIRGTVSAMAVPSQRVVA